MIAGLFEPPAALLAWFYSFTHNYIIAISMIALVVMIITAPLVLKSTKGMLEMQKLQPEMRKLQQEHRGDRQTLNAEMMKLYQEHKVNPMASCFPLLLQMPVFIIMYQVLRGLTNGGETPGFSPQYVSTGSELYRSLVGKHEMLTWGLDLAKRPSEVISESFGKGMVYAGSSWRSACCTTCSRRWSPPAPRWHRTCREMQAKLMQYLPVVFAVFLVFYLTGLVIYYMAQAIFRIGLQYYITHRFYKGEHSLGRQAQVAGERAREIAKKDGGGGGLFAQAKRQMADAKQQPAKKAAGKPADRQQAGHSPQEPSNDFRKQQPSRLDGQVGTAKLLTSQEEVGPPWNGSNSPRAHSKRPRTWPSIGLVSQRTTPSSRSWQSQSPDCSVAFVARPAFAPGFARRRPARRWIAASAVPASPKVATQHRERRSRGARLRRSRRPSHASGGGDRGRSRRRGPRITIARSGPTDRASTRGSTTQ